MDVNCARAASGAHEMVQRMLLPILILALSPAVAEAQDSCRTGIEAAARRPALPWQPSQMVTGATEAQAPGIADGVVVRRTVGKKPGSRTPYSVLDALCGRGQPCRAAGPVRLGLDTDRIMVHGNAASYSIIALHDGGSASLYRLVASEGFVHICTTQKRRSGPVRPSPAV